MGGDRATMPVGPIFMHINGVDAPIGENEVAISMEQVKELRERTGAGILDCKKVLEQANGDLNQAVTLLRERGVAVAAKKATREAREGRIETYIHAGNKLVALVELNCETDFVARNDAFIQLSKDIALHVAAVNPRFINKADVPSDVLESSDAASPEKFYEENVLLEQPFVKQPSATIGDMVRDTIAKTGENVIVRRMARFEIGA
ncbi:MAG: translation elongation factor Ts [Herpetosiphon sp.]